MHRRFCCYFILFFIAIQGVIQSAEESPFEQGIKSFYNKDWNKAEEYFQLNLLENPADSLTISFLLVSFLWDGKLDEALKNFEQQYVDKPNDTFAHLYTAYAYFARSKLDNSFIDEAQKEFEDLISKSPDLSSAYTGLGLIYEEKRMPAKAKQAFLKALELNPKDMLALEKIGVVLMLDFNSPKEALNYFSKLLELAPFYPDAQFYVASANYQLGNYDAAIPFLLKAMSLDQQGIGKGYYAPLILGDIYAKKENYEEAIKYYQKALQINPQNVAAKTKLNDIEELLKEQKKEKGNIVK